MSKILYLDDLRRELKVTTPDLFTRDLGRKAFRLLEEAIRKVPVSEALVIDAKGILLIDGSFFDEAILTLFENLRNRKYGDRFIVLVNLSEDSRLNLEGAVARRKIKGAIPTIDSKGKWIFVGTLESNLAEAVKYLTAKGEVTARELADARRISINNASNRLRRLFEARLARRETSRSESGLYHRYVTLT